MGTQTRRSTEWAVPGLNPKGHGHRASLAPWEPILGVNVIYTDASGTQVALKTAERLARGLRACVRLLKLCEVPYRLPLEEPGVAVSFLEGQLRAVAGHTSLPVVGIFTFAATSAIL